MLSRLDFYKSYEHNFGWYNDAAGLDPYACYDVLPVSPQFVASIEQAAAQVWRGLLKAAEVVKTLDDESLLALGYPAQTFRLIRSFDQEPWIARCDFAVCEDSIYLLECNTECPSLIVEAFKMNGEVANHLGMKDPNQNSEAILQAGLLQQIKSTAASIGKTPRQCNIVFSARMLNSPEQKEMLGTAEYLRSLLPYRSKFCPVEELRLDKHRLYDQNCRAIDLIYFLYPVDFMLQPREAGSACLWDWLEPIIFKRKLGLINPIDAFVIHNKAIMALITKLGAAFFEDSSFGFHHFLPSTLDIQEMKPPMVSKPIVGRQGQEIKIFRTDTEFTSFNSKEIDLNEPKLYQKYVDLPQVVVAGKPQTLQFSCFIIKGEATGIVVRIGEKIIDHNSRFLPVGYSIPS